MRAPDEPEQTSRRVNGVSTASDETNAPAMASDVKQLFGLMSELAESQKSMNGQIQQLMKLQLTSGSSSTD